MLILLALMCQPALLAYDRMVMASAAAQGVRMLATRPAGAPDSGYVEAIEGQLAAIPNTGIFHAGGPHWDIELSGDEESGEVSVAIRTSVDPLPLVGIAASALGVVDEQGRFVLEVECTEDTRPDWVSGSPGTWVSQWE